MTDDTTAYINETFQKIRQLRASSKGEVWLAADVSGKLVVIKSVAITGLPYKMLKEHPQAVAPRVIYCTEHEGVTLVVEEYIQGTSLLERLEQRQYLTEAEAEQILLGLCEGLAPLHELGIIHRDIKPSNLILQNGGIIRLIDFDAARTVKARSSEDTRLLGTKGYASPEQFGYGQTDARSDIYSIGITMQKLLGEAYQGRLTAILAKCTEIDPKMRYDSVMALKRAVLWRRRKIPYVLCGLCVAGAICMALWFMGEHEKNDVPSDETVAPVQVLPENQASDSPQLEPSVPQKAEDSSAERQDLVNQVQETNHSEKKSSVSEVVPNDVLTPAVVELPVETSFSLNGTVQNWNQAGKITLARSDWGGCYAKLHVINNSNVTWEQPSIRIVFQDNWGGSYEETKTLPPLEPGEAADFDVPVGSYPVTDRPRFNEVSAWLRVYLDHGSINVTQDYWCLRFLIRGNADVPASLAQ